MSNGSYAMQPKSGHRRLGVGVLIGVVTAGAVALPTTGWAAPVSAPTITAPSDGASVTTSNLPLQATSGAADVRFLVDYGTGSLEQTVAVDTGSAVANFAVAGLGGSLKLSAFDCDAPGDCNTVGDTIMVDVDLPAPTLTAPTQQALVGNSFAARATSANGPVGFVVDGQQMGVDLNAPYAVMVDLVGKSEGTHSVRAVQCDATGLVCQGAVSPVTQVVKDTRGPRWSRPDARPAHVYPARDHYLDTTRLSARMGEDAQSVKVLIKRHGHVMRSESLNHKSKGTVTFIWNGRANNGKVVPPGTYTFSFWAKDVRGNTSTSRDGKVVVSDKRLERVTATRTVSALGSAYKNLSGECGDVYRLNYPQARFNWPHGLGYYSRSHCTGTDEQELALALHRFRLPRAVRYGSVSIDAYGAGAYQNAGPAAELYVKSNGQFGKGRKLSTSVGWHSGPSVSLKSSMIQGSVFWGLGPSGEPGMTSRSSGSHTRTTPCAERRSRPRQFAGKQVVVGVASHDRVRLSVAAEHDGRAQSAVVVVDQGVCVSTSHRNGEQVTGVR